jgi:hypothetical protein
MRIDSLVTATKSTFSSHFATDRGLRGQINLQRVNLFCAWLDASVGGGGRVAR